MPESTIRRISRHFTRSSQKSRSDSWINLTDHSTVSLPSLPSRDFTDDVPLTPPAPRIRRHTQPVNAHFPPSSKYSMQTFPTPTSHDPTCPPSSSNPESGFSGLTLASPQPAHVVQSHYGALVDSDWEFNLHNDHESASTRQRSKYRSSSLSGSTSVRRLVRSEHEPCTRCNRCTRSDGCSLFSCARHGSGLSPFDGFRGEERYGADNDTDTEDDDTDDENKTDPQDGRTACLHAITAFWLVFTCWGLPSIYGVFQAYYCRLAPDLPDSLTSSSLQSLAWIGSTQLGLVFLLGLPASYAVEKGYFTTVFRVSSLLLAVSVLATSLCRSWISLWLVQGVLTGLGCGGITGSGLPVLTSWFSRRKAAKGMAVAAAGSCVGAIVYAVVARALLERSGFEVTFRVLGSVVAVTLLPAQFVFRERKRIKRRVEVQYGIFRRRSEVDVKPPSSTLPWYARLGKDYVFAAAGLFCAFLGLYFGFVYIVSYASDVQHLSHAESVDLLVYMMLANLLGRLFPALMSDHCIGPINTIIPCAVVSSSVIWLWTAMSAAKRLPMETLVVVACFYGFACAGIQVLFPAIAYTLCQEQDANAKHANADANDDKDASKRTQSLKGGGVTTVIGIGCLCGTPIGGALIEFRTARNMESPYLGAQMFAASSLMLAAVFLLAARLARKGWRAERI